VGIGVGVALALLVAREIENGWLVASFVCCLLKARTVEPALRAVGKWLEREAGVVVHRLESSLP
jgi:hypothetical protein